MKSMRIGTMCLITFLGAAGLAVSEEERPNASPVPAPGVKILRDLQYVKDGHERNRLDLYLPEKAQGRLPVVVWVHGGAWRAGSKDHCPAAPLTAKGFAVASINYRFS